MVAFCSEPMQKNNRLFHILGAVVSSNYDSLYVIILFLRSSLVYYDPCHNILAIYCVTSSIINFVCDLSHKLLNFFRRQKIDHRKLGNNKKIPKLVEDTCSTHSPPQNSVFGNVGQNLPQSRYQNFLVIPSFS